MASTAPTIDPTAHLAESIDPAAANSPYSLHRAVHARRAEYVRPHRIRIKVGTWNVAACPGTDKDLARWFVEGEGVDLKLAAPGLARDNSALERGAGQRAGGVDEGVRVLGGDKIGLYVLGLQEVVDLNTAAYVSRVYAADSGVAEKWKAALGSALPGGYRLVAAEQLTGLLVLVYASAEVAPTISNVDTVQVATGFWGYLGNKGAVAVRILLGESTSLVFVNCHLASGEDASALERRIVDVAQIAGRAVFQPISFAGVAEEEEGRRIGDEDYAFWFGDLNFRLDGLPGSDIRRLLTLHARGEYDVSKQGTEDVLDEEGVLVEGTSQSSDGTVDQDTIAVRKPVDARRDASETSLSVVDPEEFVPNPHEDPASLQATLDSLLPHDQLRRIMREGRAFHEGWREGPITFLPTYKYDVGTVGLFDSSEKKRAPSWCDRILYRSRQDKEAYLTRIREREAARKRDEEMKAQGLEQSEDEDVLFDYDPDNDGDDQPSGTAGLDYDEYDDRAVDGGGGTVGSEADFDRLYLDVYTSHQRIISSDHKPITSVFTLSYDAVAPELKAQVHAAVARELDRAENEGRPILTVVVDAGDSHGLARASDPAENTDHAVDLGDIRFMQKETASLTLANTGRVPAIFSFVEKPSTENSDGLRALPWLSTSFMHSDLAIVDGRVAAAERVEFGREVRLEPGETAKALLEAYIDDLAHVRALNDGQVVLEEVLVLRITDGRDHFIPVRAAWLPTCIGRSLEELIRVPEGGITAFVPSLAEKRGLGLRTCSIPYDLDVHSAAPRELFKLTEAAETLTERALADEQMLGDAVSVPVSAAGWPLDETCWTADRVSRAAHVAHIVDALDTDTPLVDVFAPETPAVERLEAVSAALLLFLRGLTDGIITTPLWARIEQLQPPLAVLGPLSTRSSAAIAADQQSFEDDKAAVLDVLATAPHHNVSFVFLTATLAKIAAELAPLSRADMEVLRVAASAGAGGTVGLARRSLSFRRSGSGAGAVEAAALQALERRRAKERRFAEVLASVVCRAGPPERERERRALEERQRAVIELFLRRRDDG